MIVLIVCMVNIQDCSSSSIVICQFISLNTKLSPSKHNVSVNKLLHEHPHEVMK